MIYQIDVLVGVDNDRIRRFKHDKLSVFGIGKDLSKKEWTTIYRQLIARNLLWVDMINHGSVKIHRKRDIIFKKQRKYKI